MGGFFLVGAVLLGALAVRTVTAEYSTGMIRSTFTAMPTRRLVLVAKAAVTAAFVFPVALLAAVVSFEVGQRVFAGKHLQVSFGHPGVLQALVFAALAVSLVAIIGVGLGGLIRHTAARPLHWCWSSSEGPCSASSFRPASVSTCPGPHSRPP